LGDYAKLSEKTIISIVQTIIKTSKRLERIISDLLTLANIENIHYKSFSLCDLKQVIRNCKEMILLAHIDVNIEENFSEESFFVLGDSGLLEMAIKNLLENAVKYSKNNPNISLFLRKDKNKIYFIDFGLGHISKKIEEKATDLLVFKKTLLSYKNTEKFWQNILEGYKQEINNKDITKKINIIEKRGRYL
jgi:K+-sensing histidine kinase KdpD